MSLLGSKFAAKGASIAFHKDDHALAAVERRGMSLNTGTLNTISIEKYEVSNFDSIIKVLSCSRESARICPLTLKSLINKQGGYVVFLVLSEYSFIRDFRVCRQLRSNAELQN